MKLYLTNRFFLSCGAIVAILILSYSYPKMWFWAIVLIITLLTLSIIEIVICYLIAKKIYISRETQDQFSLGDDQEINYKIANQSNQLASIEITDELPFQLQHRDKIYKGNLKANTIDKIGHAIRPTERGVYRFGNIHLYISKKWLNLIQLRKTYNVEAHTEVYPSFIQMKKYELQVFSKTATLSGIRRVREIGENDEFEQIRNYVVGDNVKSINWKATSRKGELMVNQYENSKSQMVYCIVDKGRSMQMPFNNLSLLDYAINTSLVMSNIVLRKYDKVGLITFSNKIGAIINADSQKEQLQKITKTLYDQETEFHESDFRLLFQIVRQRIRRRSVLMIFTNFEHAQDLQRQIKYLKALSRSHLLVVIFFTNAQIEGAANAKLSRDVKDIYFRTFAQENIMEKEKMVTELRKTGIQVILSKPEDLSINTINKYLEIKAKRMK